LRCEWDGEMGVDKGEGEWRGVSGNGRWDGS